MDLTPTETDDDLGTPYPCQTCHRRYLTRSGLATHSCKTGRVPKPGKGKSHLTDDIVLEIRQRYAEGGISTRQLAEQYEIGQATISSIINRRTWQHVPSPEGQANARPKRPRVALTDTEKEAIASDYVAGIPVYKLEAKYKRHNRTIKRILNEAAENKKAG